MCMFDKESNTLYFSGGFINLYIVDSNSNIHEYKATKSPIGSYVIDVEFALQQIKLTTGDTLYIASDGYTDQFGIPDGKEKPEKFKRKRFLSLIQSIHKLNSDEQTEILKENLETWKSGIEQIDDITVMVVKHV